MKRNRWSGSGVGVGECTAGWLLVPSGCGRDFTGREVWMEGVPENVRMERISPKRENRTRRGTGQDGNFGEISQLE